MPRRAGARQSGWPRPGQKGFQVGVGVNLR
jgi:hypothetical protein